MRSRIGVAIAIVVLAFGAAYFASPFWAAHRFRAAAVAGDTDGLEATVDFPAVRESLKAQLNVALTEKLRNDPEMRNNPFAGLGMMLLPTIVDRAVGGFVTPDGIAAIARNGRLERRGASGDTPARADIDYDYAYRGTDRFAVTVTAKNSGPGRGPTFVFERRGLFGWKLVRMEVPPEALSDRAV
ncbi:DUF2939 domain-containing protein [Sphingomonas sp. VNH70]|uniref:DUF2939 domain-containing protein n=1 Tax=Sphingomonas silueang TaxID=3156617 RepID=UPI0032B3F603